MEKKYHTYLNIWRRICTALILAFMLQIANQAFFFHSHKTADGRTYNHAHPNHGKHSHGQQQCYFFDHFDSIGTGDAEQLITVSTYAVENSYAIVNECLAVHDFFKNVSGRAPPMA